MTRSACLALAVAAMATGGSAQTRHFHLDTPRALAGSLSSGVAISPDGALRPLPPLHKVAEFDEPLGLALAVAGDGTAYVGSGRPARVYRVRGNSTTLLAELEADQVTALLLAPGGDLYAATAVPALLVRLAATSGTSEVMSRLAEGNLWDLAWFDGQLLAAAGNPGRLLRLGRGGLELAASIPDRHARCLAVTGSTVWIGTSGKGLALRWSGQGPAGMVYDSPFTEIAALAAAPDGTVYAAGLTGDPTMGAPPANPGGEVTVSTGSDAPTPPKTDSGATATSEIVRIHPSGAATPVHRFSRQLAGTLSWGRDGLVVGTGLEGELWHVVEGAAARLDSVDAAQVVRVVAGGDTVLTQGPVMLLARSGAPGGTFTSPVQDAGQPAAWGEVRARSSGPCSIRFRSGNAASIDDTWSQWSESQPCSRAHATAPPARYLQWQIALERDAVLETVAVAFRQFNLPPLIDEITVHDAAEVFLKSPPPSDRAVSVTHPTKAGIFTILDSEASDSARMGKKYYLVGYQTVSWKASDPNNDALLFDVEIQRAGNDRFWPVARRLESASLSIDSHALADGSYRFRITASDSGTNTAAPASTSALSRWFTIDNTPPHIEITRRGDVWFIVVEDASSPLTIAEANRDAERWEALTPEDGLLDGRRETFRVPVAKGAHVLAVRTVDAHHNRATVAVEETP